MKSCLNCKKIHKSKTSVYCRKCKINNNVCVKCDLKIKDIHILKKKIRYCINCLIEHKKQYIYCIICDNSDKKKLSYKICSNCFGLVSEYTTSDPYNLNDYKIQEIKKTIDYNYNHNLTPFLV